MISSAKWFLKHLQWNRRQTGQMMPFWNLNKYSFMVQRSSSKFIYKKKVFAVTEVMEKKMGLNT